MNTDPLVSVVIPTKDRWQLLDRALGSVLGQEEVELEAIVVDDGSAEPPPAGGRALLDERVTLLTHECSQGVARSRNHGIAHARGAWVAFLDDDDLWAPAKLRRQLEACASRSADFSYTSQLVVSLDLTPQLSILPPPADRLAEELLGCNVIGSPSSVMVRRAVLEEVGGFDPEYSILADWDLWLRLSAVASGAACPEPLTGYTLHDTNMHLDPAVARAEFRRLRKKHAGLARAAGRRIGGEEWWRWFAFANRRLGRRHFAAAIYLATSIRYLHPRDAARSIGLLFGESMMSIGQSEPPPAPEWLARLQPPLQACSSPGPHATTAG